MPLIPTRTTCLELTAGTTLSVASEGRVGSSDFTGTFASEYVSASMATFPFDPQHFVFAVHHHAPALKQLLDILSIDR